MNILFEDNSIIVMEKPAGIPVQTKKLGEKCLETELKKYRRAKGQSPEIFVVHRLDQPVSGIMVFAKTSKAAGELTKQMMASDFSKEYRALAYKGEKLPDKGTLKDYLLKDEKTNSSKVVLNKDKGAKEAVLDYEITDSKEKETELYIYLKTGRHHQIRVQFANAGCPLLGDLKYGTKESISYSEERGIKTVNLCACHLEFNHPDTKKKLEFTI